MHCPLCGCEFDQTDQSCTGKCPMAAIQGCSLICCPNCGYQMVDETRSAAAKLLRRLLHPPIDPGEQEPTP
jgi:hypothetical protein